MTQNDVWNKRDKVWAKEACNDGDGDVNDKKKAAHLAATSELDGKKNKKWRWIGLYFIWSMASKKNAKRTNEKLNWKALNEK